MKNRVGGGRDRPDSTQMMPGAVPGFGFYASRVSGFGTLQIKALFNIRLKTFMLPAENARSAKRPQAKPETGNKFFQRFHSSFQSLLKYTLAIIP